MTLEEFVSAFADEMMGTRQEITADTRYRELDVWGSLASLSIISLIDEEYGKLITGADVRSCDTVRELYEFVEKL